MKRMAFLTNGAEQLQASTKKRMKSDFFLTGCTKSNLKCVIGLNVTAKMIKLLGKKKHE